MYTLLCLLDIHGKWLRRNVLPKEKLDVIYLTIDKYCSFNIQREGEFSFDGL